MRFLQIVKGMNVCYLLRMGIIIGNRKRAFRLFSKPVERNKDCPGLSYIDSGQLSSALSFHPFSKDIYCQAL